MEGTRILLVEGSGRGFLSHYAHALALGLHELGQRVRLVTGRRDELAHWSTPFGKAACLADGTASWACLAREVRRYRPDVVHFQWIGQPLMAAACAAFLRRRGIATAYTPHNLLPHRRRWLSTPGYRRFYASVDRVVARDANIAWGLEEVMDVSARAVVQLPGSPNLMAHPDLPRRRPAELTEPDDETPMLLHFGHGSTRKGLDVLAASLAGPLAALDARVVIAGEGVAGALPPDLRSRLADDPRVTIIDRYLPSEEVAWLFARSRLLLLPYTKLCESPLLDLAAQFALPVVRSPRVTGARFIDGLHGLTMTEATGTALAEVVHSGLTPNSHAGMQAALRREEAVSTAIQRLAEGHLRLYKAMQEHPLAARHPSAHAAPALEAPHA